MVVLRLRLMLSEAVSEVGGACASALRHQRHQLFLQRAQAEQLAQKHDVGVARVECWASDSVVREAGRRQRGWRAAHYTTRILHLRLVRLLVVDVMDDAVGVTQVIWVLLMVLTTDAAAIVDHVVLLVVVVDWRAA